MSKLRSISTATWSDSWFEELPVDHKLLFIYLLTNEHTNMLGIYEISLRKISFETGIPRETIQKALEGFEKVNKVKYKDNYVVLINYLKHQKFNTNMKKSAIDVYNDLPDEIKVKDLQIISKDLKGFETLCKAFGTLRKIEVEEEYEIEEEVEYEIETQFPKKNPHLVFEAEDLKRELLNSYEQIEKIMKLHKELSEDDVKNYIVRFVDEQDAKDDLRRPFKEIRSHLVSWVNTQEKERKRNESRNSSKKQSTLDYINSLE